MKKIIFGMLILIIILLIVLPPLFDLKWIPVQGINDLENPYGILYIPTQNYSIELKLNGVTEPCCYFYLWNGGIIHIKNVDLTDILKEEEFIHIKTENFHLVLECIKIKKINFFNLFSLRYLNQIKGDIIIIDNQRIYRLIIL